MSWKGQTEKVIKNVACERVSAGLAIERETYQNIVRNNSRSMRRILFIPSSKHSRPH